MNAQDCPAYWHHPSVRADRPGFPPLPPAQIVEPAGLGPVAKGLPITPWSRDDLAHQAVAEGLVSSLSAATIRRLSNRVDWQPHRTRYWKTSRRDAQSKRRAAKILWCSADADRLAQRGDGIVGLAEMPTRQALGRDPLRRPSPGSIEQPGFESTRHGTVTIPVSWIVPTGRMEAVCVEKKDALHDIEQRERSRDRHRDLEGVYLIQDGDPRHTAVPPRSYFAKARGGWRPRFTPGHASWLNPTGLLHPGFGLRPLRRGSWRRREEYIAHGDASWPEYNERYAEPFEGTWTNHKMRKWFFEHAR